MSHIPNSAMPHAGPTEAEEAAAPTLRARAGRLAEKARGSARANPKTAIAAGAALVAGAVAAAAIPAVRAARQKSAGGSSRGSKKAAKR